MDKNHKDPVTIDLNAPRRAQYLHKAWKKHQNAVYWVDINLALKKGLKFYQTRSNATFFTKHFQLIVFSKVVRMETGEVMYEIVYMSPRPPPKISLTHDWKRELGSEDAQRPEGQVVQQSRCLQSNQPIPNPGRDRTGQPVVRTDRTLQPVVGTNTRTAQDGRKTSRSQKIDTRSFHDEAVKTDRTGQPVVNHDESSHEQTMLNEVNMDFQIPGLPHPVVKHAAESSRALELVKKIENHPDRHPLQQDLRQNKAYNPFSVESKRMIQDVGNVELFEVFETDPKTQCKAMLIILE